MSDKKISQLDAVDTVADTDEYEVARTGNSYKITGASLKAELGGSSTVIGTSYLICYVPDSATGITMGAPHTITWTQASQAGDDISLHAGGQWADIATTGWYAVRVSAGFLGALNQTQLLVSTLGDFTDGGLNDQDVYLSQDPAVGAYDMELSAPCVKLSSGATVQVRVYADNSDSSGTYTSEETPTSLSIVRLA